MDLKSSFSNRYLFEENYVKRPSVLQDENEDKVCLLKKELVLCQELSVGYNVSSLKPSLFITDGFSNIWHICRSLYFTG